MAEARKEHAAPGSAGVRLDKWLWAARLFKTRSLAAEEIGRGRVQVNGQEAKPAREIRPGDVIAVRRTGLTQELEVLGLSAQRGPAPQAQLLYRRAPQLDLVLQHLLTIQPYGNRLQ